MEWHRAFSTSLFNQVWELLDREDRTDEESERMIDTAHASRYHWRMRDDAEPRNLAISAWQLSRVYAEAGLAEQAGRCGRESLELCTANGLGAFLTGYAHEALARAAVISGNPEEAERNLVMAGDLAAVVEDQEERAILLGDLDEVASLR